MVFKISDIQLQIIIQFGTVKTINKFYRLEIKSTDRNKAGSFFFSGMQFLKGSLITPF